MSYIIIFLVIVTITFASSNKDAPNNDAYSSKNKKDVETSIVGGTEVPPGKYEFMAGLRFEAESDNSCGGSLIDPTHILTAAHCLDKDGIDPNDVFKYVSVGSRYKSGNEDGYLIRVKSAIIHPMYNTIPLEDYDFAIIELEEAVNDIVPAKLANAAKYEEAGLIATTAGWGALDEDRSSYAEIKMEVDVPIVDQDECIANITAVKPDWLISPAMICAGGGTANKDSCYGDSGGPLFVMENDVPIVIGIVSTGIECAYPNAPGIYARVSAGLDFILEHSSASVANGDTSTSSAKDKHWWW